MNDERFERSDERFERSHERFERSDARFERSLRATLATDAPAAAPASLHRFAASLDDATVHQGAGGVALRLIERIAALGLVAAVVVAVVAMTAGRASPDAGVGGTGAAPSIRWSTQFASLAASGMWIETGGRRFVGSAPVDVRSDPGNATYRTLEMTWHEQGSEMRFFVYFGADSRQWWVSQLRTYDGRTPANWAYYDGPFFTTPIGQAYRGTVDLASDRTDSIPGHLHIDDMTLSAFGLMANASLGPQESAAPSGGPVVSPLPGSATAPASTAAAASPGGSSLPSPNPADVAAVRNVVTTFEQDRAAAKWQAAWNLLSPWQQSKLPYRSAVAAFRSYAAGGGNAFAIKQVTNDWTVLNYAYAGELEADIRAHADAARALAVWVNHPGINAASAGSEGLLVAPMNDGSGWRIWIVH